MKWQPAKVRYKDVEVEVAFQVPSTLEEWAKLTGTDPLEVLNQVVVRRMQRELNRELDRVWAIGEVPDEETIRSMAKKLADEWPVPYLGKDSFSHREALEVQELIIHSMGEKEAYAYVGRLTGRVITSPAQLREGLRQLYASQKGRFHAQETQVQPELF